MKTQNKKFSFETIENFDKHISASIQGYDLLNSLIVSILDFFIKKKSRVLDLGCTSGRLLIEIKKRYKDEDVTCTGVDITDHNFPEYPYNEGVHFQVLDIASECEGFHEHDIILSVFTLQFVEINKRQAIVDRIFEALPPGGVFVFCEKEYANSSRLQDVFTFANYDYKRKSFGVGQILDKERDLRRIMSPLKARSNIAMLQNAGFRTIEPFFQSLNFKGYIAIK